VLNEHERETLREIQRHLVVEDPAFEEPFRAFDIGTPRARYRWVYTTLVVITAVLAPIVLVAGSPGGAFAFAVIAGTLWWTRHLEDVDRRGQPGS
jgi:hypothetical protein